MDYMDVPKELLDLAVSVSKAANAEYWACDVAVGKDGKYRILECATAFAAFPYIRDWIGQYIMYLISDGKFKKPNIPLYNWEELGKIDSSLLRTMRYITFGKYSASFDGEYFMKKKRETSDGQEYIFDLDNRYPMLDVKERVEEEWPSEKYNFQDKYPLKSIKSMEVDIPKGADESALDLSKIKEEELYAFLTTSIKGIGDKKATQMLDKYGKEGLIELIENNPNTLLTIEGMNENIVKKLLEQWSRFKEMLKL
jgi:hypothetical protein